MNLSKKIEEFLNNQKHKIFAVFQDGTNYIFEYNDLCMKEDDCIIIGYKYGLEIQYEILCDAYADKHLFYNCDDDGFILLQKNNTLRLASSYEIIRFRNQKNILINS